jgi:hypothetical protein
MSRPHFLITIDTEGDDLWDRPKVVTTRNANYLARFQELCEHFALRPTYLTNYEMARCPVFQRFGREVLERGTAEIGMHLHAWDSPPIVALTSDDRAFQPYLVEYSDRLMREKIRAVTGTLEDTFGIKMVSHRAGRWGFDERYASMLVDEGYLVDCSVTPLISWRRTLGDPSCGGGPDYTAFPQHAYWLDYEDISRPGNSPLLEVPVTVIANDRSFTGRVSRRVRAFNGLRAFIPRRLRKMLGRAAPAVQMLYPDGNNRHRLLDILARVVGEGRDYAELVLHSSELMPGGSPTFRDAAGIEALYGDLAAVFGAAREQFRGSTLAEYHASVAARALVRS